MTSTPRLSVVVVPLEGASPLERCLSALLRQTGAPALEVVVPWDATRGGASRLRKAFPQVNFFEVPGRRTYAELRALGVQQSHGDIVALTEDHCVPRQDWCAQIVASHAASHAAIGGAVEKQEPDTALNWSFYFADYLRYLDPAEGPSPHLTDCNVTYKRAALDAIPDVCRGEFHENIVHQALRDRGQSLWLSPHIVVRQQRSFSFSAALWDRYAFGRLFASTRARGIDIPRRAVLLASTALLPALLVARIAAHLLRTRRYAAQFLRSLPLVLLISAAWAAGEFMGHLTGQPERMLKVREAAS